MSYKNETSAVRCVETPSTSEPFINKSPISAPSPMTDLIIILSLIFSLSSWGIYTTHRSHMKFFKTVFISTKFRQFDMGNLSAVRITNLHNLMGATLKLGCTANGLIEGSHPHYLLSPLLSLPNLRQDEIIVDSGPCGQGSGYYQAQANPFWGIKWSALACADTKWSGSPFCFCNDFSRCLYVPRGTVRWELRMYGIYLHFWTPYYVADGGTVFAAEKNKQKRHQDARCFSFCLTHPIGQRRSHVVHARVPSQNTRQVTWQRSRLWLEVYRS